jgi:hypothetical protein
MGGGGWGIGGVSSQRGEGWAKGKVYRIQRGLV